MHLKEYMFHVTTLGISTFNKVKSESMSSRAIGQ